MKYVWVSVLLFESCVGNSGSRVHGWSVEVRNARSAGTGRSGGVITRNGWAGVNHDGWKLVDSLSLYDFKLCYCRNCESGRGAMREVRLSELHVSRTVAD